MLCGEFLSREVVALLTDLGVYSEFLELHPHGLSQFRLSFGKENPVMHRLGFEAYAMKRSVFDHFLLQTANRFGTAVMQPASVVSVQHQDDDSYAVGCETPDGLRTITARVVIAAYGRRNFLDKQLSRNFIHDRSGYTGIKYHLPISAVSLPDHDAVHLFLARGMYCGLNIVSDTEVTMCFLFDGMKHNFDPHEALSALIDKNAAFRSVLNDDMPSTLRNLPPYGTGHIYFGPRNIIERGLYMIGDAAGVIAPLAGDGIGIAMESGRLASETILAFLHGRRTRNASEQFYRQEWKRIFSKRLSFALRLQNAALHERKAKIGIHLLHAFPWLTGTVIRKTRNTRLIG